MQTARVEVPLQAVRWQSAQPLGLIPWLEIELHLAKTGHPQQCDWYNVGAERNGYFPLVDFQKGKTLVSRYDRQYVVRPYARSYYRFGDNWRKSGRYASKHGA